MKYQNPILPGYYPDPSVCRVRDTFYLVTSSFEYFPGVPLFRSKDLVNWEQIGHCLTRRSQLDLDGVKSSGGIYAPTIRHHGGRFYMVTTDTTGIGNFYVWTDDPEGEWSDPLWVDQGGIDPSIFWDDDGQAWFTSNALWMPGPRGIYMNAIDLETGKLRDLEPLWLWGGTGGKYPEAPHHYKKDGWYYLLIAEGGTEFGHMISIARSRSIGGSYESCPHNPILSHRSSSNPIQSTGHGDLFEDANGDWWMVFLGVRHSSYPLVHHLGRETYLAPVSWNAEGWPVVNGGRLVELRMDVDRHLPYAPTASPPARDDFDSHTLRPEWNFCRNPVEGSWKLDSGNLVLKCLPGGLDEIQPKAWVGRRQQHFYAKANTTVDFQPATSGEQAGLTAYMNERHHAEIALTMRDGKRAILFKARCGSMVCEETFPCEQSGPVTFSIESDEEYLHFLADQRGAPVELGKIETRFLSTEMAGGFTGLYWALYATSGNGGGENTAAFGHFEYLPLHDDREWDRTLEPVTQKPQS